MILVDTSVYISALRDKELEKKIKEGAKKAIIISSIVVEEEISDAANFLKRRGDKIEAERLKELYNASTGGKIGLTPLVLKLAEEYADKVKERFGKKKAKDMRDDFRIVSAASAAAVSTIGTFNRKTMANEEIIAIYRKINVGHKLKTPRFIKSRDELIKFLALL